MDHPLIGLWLGHATGRSTGPHGLCPPHLMHVTWRFVCECGLTWHTQTDAVYRDGQWEGPRRPCTICHTWVDGHRIGDR